MKDSNTSYCYEYDLHSRSGDLSGYTVKWADLRKAFGLPETEELLKITIMGFPGRQELDLVTVDTKKYAKIAEEHAERMR